MYEYVLTCIFKTKHIFLNVLGCILKYIVPRSLFRPLKLIKLLPPQRKKGNKKVTGMGDSVREAKCSRGNGRVINRKSMRLDNDRRTRCVRNSLYFISKYH